MLLAGRGCSVVTFPPDGTLAATEACVLLLNVDYSKLSKKQVFLSRIGVFDI
jgi:hypothetical protein